MEKSKRIRDFMMVAGVCLLGAWWIFGKNIFGEEIYYTWTDIFLKVIGFSILLLVMVGHVIMICLQKEYGKNLGASEKKRLAFNYLRMLGMGETPLAINLLITFVGVTYGIGFVLIVFSLLEGFFYAWWFWDIKIMVVSITFFSILAIWNMINFNAYMHVRQDAKTKIEL